MRNEDVVPNTPLNLEREEKEGKGKKRAFSCLSCRGWSAQFGPPNPTSLVGGGEDHSGASVGEKASTGTEAGAAGGRGAASLEKQEGGSRKEGHGSTVLSQTLRSPMTAWSVPAANHGALNSIAEYGKLSLQPPGHS